MMIQPVPGIAVLRHLSTVIGNEQQALAIRAVPERSIKAQDFCLVEEVRYAVENDAWDT